MTPEWWQHFFVFANKKKKKDKLGIGGPLLFPDCLSDGKKSQKHENDRQERLCGLLVDYHFSTDDWHVMSVQKASEVRHIYEWVESSRQPATKA